MRIVTVSYVVRVVALLLSIPTVLVRFPVTEHRKLLASVLRKPYS
jgi:hypothetical protein